MTVDPAALVTTSGRMAVQTRIEDDGPPPDGLLVMDGTVQAWTKLSEVPSRSDDGFLSYLDKVPAVTVAVVRGACRGYAASVVARADLAVAVGSGPRTDDFPFLVMGDETSVAGRLVDLASAVERRPRAAVATAQLLRGSEKLPVPAALVAESASYAMLQGSGEFIAWLASRSEGQ